MRAEGRSSAESARGDVVEPLKEEVERMRQQLEEAQAMYEVGTTNIPLLKCVGNMRYL